MNANQYWPQHKVFFLATLVLCPEKLTTQSVDPWFFSPYFIGGDHEFMDVLLSEYQQGGYLKYQKDRSGNFEISQVNTEKAKHDLTEYLNKWQQNALDTLSANIPPDAEYQNELLMKALASIMVGYHASRLLVKLSDVFGDPSNYEYEPSFWETVLSPQLLDGQIQIMKFGYDRRQDGEYDDNPQPYAVIKFVDKVLLANLSTSNNQSATNISPAATHDQQQRLSAIVFMDGPIVLVQLGNEEPYKIAKLDEKEAPYLFMKYLTDPDNQDIDIHLEDVQMIEGCESVNNLSELARNCGFDLALKKVFFIKSTRDTVRFKPHVKLDENQLSDVKKGRL